MRIAPMADGVRLGAQATATGLDKGVEAAPQWLGNYGR